MSNVQPLVDPKRLDAFVESQQRVEKALEHARPFAGAEPFKSREEAGQAADAIASLRHARTDAESDKKAVTAEWRASVAAVNAEFKELLSPVEGAERALKNKTLAFQKAEEAREREAQRQEEERLQKEAEQRAADAQAAAEVVQAEPENPEAQDLANEMRQEAAAAASVPAPTQRAIPKQVSGQMGKLGSRRVWRFEITDEGQVPDTYKTVNPAAIKAAIDAEAGAVRTAKEQGLGKAFALDIPGVRIFPEDIPVSR